ncbi:MAG TPA: MurR/RpiR family transcriptional regulator [candidate division Zixibacteria bacterium]|nr:MurR/RpiR family transcriptional regulator [candidate division Zixibacteria bacterium]
MTSASSPRDQILANFPNLPPKQRRLARYFIDHEDVVAFASTGQIAAQTGASAATVVRFCQALGYEGYPDLQAAIRSQLPQYRTAVQKLAERITDGNLTEHLPAQIAQANINNTQKTLSQVSDSQLTNVVDAIIHARNVSIFGNGLSAAAAISAEYALSVLGFAVRACTDGGMGQLLEISRLTDQDLVIVISVWRYLRSTVEAAEAARAAGATCIAITDSPVAPVATLADHVFITDIEGAVHSRSLSGVLSLIDLISAAIVAERPQESLEALQRIDTFYLENDMLLSD